MTKLKYLGLLGQGFLLYILCAGAAIAEGIALDKVALKVTHAKANWRVGHGLNITFNDHPKAQVQLSLAGDRKWNFDNFHGLQVELTNTGNTQIQPAIRFQSTDTRKWAKTEHSTYLAPGETKTLLAYFYITDQAFSEQYPQYRKMNAGPNTKMQNWSGIDNGNIDKISLFPIAVEGHFPAKGQITVNNIQPFRFSERFSFANEPKFPFVDEYGQYLHGHYPGKLVDSKEWQGREQQELAELNQFQGPKDRSRFGGWLNGPELKATGYFYTTQLEGKWWLVDPDGHLFWSHGVTGVGQKGANTLVTGREHYFQNLPDKEGDLGAFYSKEEQSRFNFTAANLKRKYGENWREKSLARNHQRLKSWGMNTYGNWSQVENTEQYKTPFTVAIHYKTRMLEKKFPDPFDINFVANIQRALVQAKQNEQADSPWNIGFFVNNELHFYQSWAYAKIISSAAEDQPAKRFYVQHLETKYRDISKLNARWGTDFNSFTELLNQRQELTHQVMGEDAEWFYQQLVERYFRLSREAVKSIFPNHLYLGSRVHGDTNEVVLRGAEKYADVISYNLYRRNLGDFTSRAKGLTKPLMATEFHFGALDRGVFHTGLQAVSSQKERAQHYYEYVKSALLNPLFVGTHWFQYRAQAITGRGDGENYQIGLVDVTDTPYPETIEAVRQIGYQMYQLRHGTKLK